jgi:predicted naringenin-chalcone synthase
MPPFPRILGIASAAPSYHYDQATALATVQRHILGKHWPQRPELADRAEAMARLFAASRVEHRQGVVDLATYYRQRRSTGERMAQYAEAAYTLGQSALHATLAATAPLRAVRDISDFFTISCTGYTAPGLDILLARDLGLSPATRRVNIGHMGCFGALVGLRQSLAAVRAEPEATAAMLCVELCSLHFQPSEDPEILTSFALFGDAAAALTLGYAPDAPGPEVVGMYCAADFAAAEQMSWRITDEGFVMGLSPRVPVTLRRNIQSTVEHLLAPQGLGVADITHWLVHPGGPSILEAIQRRLELSEEQMALSWQILRDHGNCSSATVLLMLEALLQSGTTRRGEWGVMMAFGPGLTLETCLLRF